MLSPPIPFEIDEARLAPPVVRPTSIAKAGAIAALCAASGPVATIVAPAGYGKTTLLGHWAKEDPRPFAWVSLDERDDDALVLLRDVAAAIHRVQPIAPRVFEALAGQRDTIWSRVPPVGNAMAALERPMVVALDDLHSVTNPRCLELLAALIDYVPPGSQIAVASRAEPALPIARWRAHGMVVEIGTADLRLDTNEADILLRGASVALDVARVAKLAEQTEGWAAGLYLAALSIRSGAPDVARSEGFAGDDRYVSEYFRLEVLSRLPRREVRFMMRTSVLDTLNGGICDAVVGAAGSARMLELLERSNRFVVALDNRRESYRYHHLFRQLLRIELQRSEPEAATELHRRAMRWCIENKRLEDAIRFGQAAMATETVADLVDRLALPVYYDGRLDTVDGWLGWFDRKDLATFPAIAVYAGWVRALTGNAAEASRYLALAERSTSHPPLSDGSSSIAPWAAILRAAMMPEGAEAALADVSGALRQLPPGSMWRPPAMICRGIARALVGPFERAREDLLAAFEEGQSFGAPDVRFLSHAMLALLEAARGSWLDAARSAEAARSIVEDAHLEHYALSALAHVAVARVAIHGRRHAEARAAMTRAHRLRPLMDHGMPWLTVQVGIELTRAHLALGEADAARTVHAETLAVLSRRPRLGMLVGQAGELTRRLAAIAGPGAWAVNLTAAELRLLPYLATHLTYPEIAGRLFVTSHTIRTQVKSIMRKFDATSRAEAVERAVEVGLLEPMFPHRANVAV